MELKDICQYVPERVATATLTRDNYISTENMLPNKGGVVIASGVPAGNAVAFAKGDVLVSNIRPYFKKIWQADKNGGCSADVLCFRTNKNVDRNYFYYLLSQQSFFDYVMSGSKGCKMPRGDKKQIMQWVIELPSFEEQQQIASILSSLDAKIELNRRINDNLEQQALVLFKAWFVDNAVMSDASVSNYFVPLRGKNLLTSDAKGGEIPVVAGGLVPSAYHNKANTKAPVITISASGANAGYVNLWGIPVWASDSSYIDNTITPYVYFWFCLLKFNQKNIYDSQTGSAQPHIYPKHIGDVRIPNLDINRVSCFNKIVTPLYKQITQLQKTNMQLVETRDTLLPRLISGKMKIK